MGKGWREAERVRPSGKIRLTANLWIRGDASRRQRKGRGAEVWAGIERRMAGSGTGTAKRGRFAWRRISGYAATLRAASEKWRGAEGIAGMGEGMARGGTGAVKRGDSPDGESLDTRRRRSRRQRKWRGAERVRTNAQEKPPPSGGFSCVREGKRGLPRGRGGRGRGPGRGRRCRGRRG